jgi:hypothetical protein
MKTCVPIGGLFAAGFDPSGKYLLAISHSGRGVFSTETWLRVARDYDVVYPEGGNCVGIGPIAGQVIPVTEMDYASGTMKLRSPNGRIVLKCESSEIVVEERPAEDYEQIASE